MRINQDSDAEPRDLRRQRHQRRWSKIGSIGEIYVDDSTGEPSFVTVKTGLFGMAESFVPLRDASVTGGDIRVAYSKHEVKDAPRVDPDGRLTPAEEQRLYAHYGLSGRDGYTGETDRVHSRTGTTAPAATTPPARDRLRHDPVGRSGSGSAPERRPVGPGSGSMS